MTKPRFEAAGGYVIDWERQRLCSFGNSTAASDAAKDWNAGNEFYAAHEWRFDGIQPPARPADCPEHYWAAPYQCMEVRDAILERIEASEPVSLAVAADWAVVFQYVWRCMFKGQTVSDLRKIEHYARILRERLEGRK